MDPRDLAIKEIDILECVTNWWKGNRFWMLGADILRLESADPVVFAEHSCNMMVPSLLFLLAR